MAEKKRDSKKNTNECTRNPLFSVIRLHNISIMISVEISHRTKRFVDYLHDSMLSCSVHFSDLYVKPSFVIIVDKNQEILIRFSTIFPCIFNVENMSIFYEFRAKKKIRESTKWNRNFSMNQPTKVCMWNTKLFK